MLTTDDFIQSKGELPCFCFYIHMSPSSFVYWLHGWGAAERRRARSNITLEHWEHYSLDGALKKWPPHALTSARYQSRTYTSWPAALGYAMQNHGCGATSHIHTGNTTHGITHWRYVISSRREFLHIPSFSSIYQSRNIQAALEYVIICSVHVYL